MSQNETVPPAQPGGIDAIMAMLGQQLVGGIEGKLKALETATENRLQELEKLATKQRPVMDVKVDGIERKLSSKMVPYLKRMIVNAKGGMNTLLVGPAGCGKTTAARQLAEALGLPFATVTLTAGASETWLFGRHTPNGFINGGFAELFEKGGVFLADEYDAADANLLLAINTPLANGCMLNPMSGRYIERHKDFVFVAAANTVGKGADHIYTGRNRLDGASLDRFIGNTIAVDYDAEFERAMCGEHVALYEGLAAVRARFKVEGIQEIVSTRCFDHCARLLSAKVPMTEIIDSVGLPWPEEARKVLKDELVKAAKIYKPAQKSQSVKDLHDKMDVAVESAK